MQCFVLGILLVHATNACMDCLDSAATTVHIKNIEGPIYLTCDRSPTCETRYPALNNLVPTGDNLYPKLNHLAPTCDNLYPTLNNFAPTCDHLYPTLNNFATTCDHLYPTLNNIAPTCENQSPILHGGTVPYHETICETDCKCITKHQSSCVPVTNVQQGAYIPSCTPGTPSCTTGYYYPQYAEGYGYMYPEVQPYPTDVSCPKISETLIPLLKTYLSQGSGKCPQSNCQCGHSHSQYYS